MEKYEKAVLELVELKNDVIRTSGCTTNTGTGVSFGGLGGDSMSYSGNGDPWDLGI